MASNEVDMGGLTLIVKDLKVNAATAGAAGTALSTTELEFLDTVTAGTVTASKAVVVDSNKDIGDFRNVGITGQIDDTNGNEQIKFTATASAVNEFTITNAATGGRPSIETTGGDTDVGLVLKSKGKSEVRLNSRDYVNTTGDSIGLQVTPNQAATTTGEVFGAQFKPRVADTFDAATCNGIGIDSELKGSGGGALSSDLRGINMYLGSTGSGTIGGNIVGLRMRVESNINPTGDIVMFLPVQHEGSQGWDGMIKFDAALGTHSMTTASDKTANTKSGTIKVRGSDGTLYHIQLYADS